MMFGQTIMKNKHKYILKPIPEKMNYVVTVIRVKY